MSAVDEYERFARDYRYSHMTAGEGVRKADAAIVELTSECGVRANEASGFRTRIAELEAKYSDVVAEHENELALRLEAEAELAALKEQANTIDVRPNGRYLTNVHPVILNVVEDGYVEYLNLNLGEYKVKSWAEREKP